MENNHHIPPSELELARKIGAYLDEDRPILDIEDPLTEQTINHRKQVYSLYRHEIEESKSRSWDTIAKQMDDPSISNPSPATTRISILNRSIKRPAFIRAAAILLLTALLSILYLQIDSSNEEIVAEAGSAQITHILSDHSRVNLRPHSTLSIVEESNELVRYKLEGEAFFTITKNKDRQFLVEAGPGLIEVTGTTFNIREWTDETTVYLQNGSLKLHTLNNSQTVSLKPGELAAVSPDYIISEPLSSDGNEFISWQQNHIILTNRTVNSVIRELEYHYSIDLSIPDELKNEELGGALTLENKKLSLENLGTALGGEFTSTGEDSYLFVD